jgi:site-specific DNA-methyltransferase (adenine-specific)
MASSATLSLFDTLEQPNLFDAEADEPEPALSPSLSQWFTPAWAAMALVEKYFPNLTSKDLVLEPSCGAGAFLKAIPAHVPVIGVEIDPEIAEQARLNTGRQVIIGDFSSAKFPDGITAMIGNPPFTLSIVEKFLDRAYRVLPKDGSIGLLLPAYAFQTTSRVLRMNEKWSLRVDMIPRRLFDGLILPLSFCMFTKDQQHRMVGLALYAECGAIDNLTKPAQELLKKGKPRTSVWKALVEETLQKLGGRATLDEIYRAIEPRRPTATAFWREKVRQQLQFCCEHIGPSEWSLQAA